jgi:hypothetical protein
VRVQVALLARTLAAAVTRSTTFDSIARKMAVGELVGIKTQSALYGGLCPPTSSGLGLAGRGGGRACDQRSM